MKIITPSCPNTKVIGKHTWVPHDFDDFMLELGHNIAACSGDDPSPLFRGHIKNEWLLDSTFVRTCKSKLFNIEPHLKLEKRIVDSFQYHQVLMSLLLFKFEVLVNFPPLGNFVNLEDVQEMDELFEGMKYFQQYPERDHPRFPGTFFIDWSKSKDVALYFLNESRDTDGALWICDAVATGKTLQTIKVRDILDKMIEASNEGQAPGCPLMFHPPKQLHSQRANNQEAVYFAQMDLRYDLADIWSSQEEATDMDERIFMKLILPDGTQEKCRKYLLEIGMTSDFIFPKNEL